MVIILSIIIRFIIIKILPKPIINWVEWTELLVQVSLFPEQKEMILIWITVRKCKVIPRMESVDRFSHS